MLLTFLLTHMHTQAHMHTHAHTHTCAHVCTQTHAHVNHHAQNLMFEQRAAAGGSSNAVDDEATAWLKVGPELAAVAAWLILMLYLS